MPYAFNERIRIHYQIEGKGPPLVLQHWSFATLDSWYDNGYVSALKDNHQLILIDARGHGRSDKPYQPEAYGLEHRVNDIVAVLDDLNIDKAHFLGYSMGGWIGFGIARYAPERFQSLIIGGQHCYTQKLDGLRQLVRYGIENGSEAFVAMWEKNFSTLSPEARERMLKYDFVALLAVAQDRQSQEEFLPRMKIPCMLFVGEVDSIYPMAKECAEQIPNVVLVSLPGFDHGETIQRSDVVLPHVLSFLKGVE